MRKWQGITLHHSASSTDTKVADIRKWHLARGFKDIGYHFVIEIDEKGRGHLKAGRSTELAGAHAGNAWFNSHTLGICVVGNYEVNKMSDMLYKDVLNALKHIINKFKISPVQIYGHKDAKATACPGKHFPLEQIKRELVK